MSWVPVWYLDIFFFLSTDQLKPTATLATGTGLNSVLAAFIWQITANKEAKGVKGEKRCWWEFVIGSIDKLELAWNS